MVLLKLQSMGIASNKSGWWQWVGVKYCWIPSLVSTLLQSYHEIPISTSHQPPTTYERTSGQRYITSRRFGTHVLQNTAHKDFVNCFESWHNPYGWCQDYNSLQLGPHHKTQDAFNHFSHAYNNKAIFDPSNWHSTWLGGTTERHSNYYQSPTMFHQLCSFSSAW